MLVVESAQAMQQQAMAWNATGAEIGCVPTMGALHAGHESLIVRARRENSRVIVSIFVNPRQFGPHEDMSSYPRPFERDREILERLGADAVFHPAVEQIYPATFRTRVDPGPWGSLLEGQSRPGHFAGVVTVVLKLLQLTQPRRAYFGQKDVQQLLLVRQLVRDFALPVRVVACPTVRDPDGLALSSRNAYLDPGQRRAAAGIYRALKSAAGLFQEGVRDPARLEGAVRELLGAAPEMTVDYVAVFDETTMRRPATVAPGSVLAVAVKLGSTRLIDNVVFGAENL